MSKTTVALICPRHGFILGDHCQRCLEEKPKDTLHINTESWLPGWYEHINKTPIYIRDKAQLKMECGKRGLLARSLMKPKSIGQGYEMR